MPTTTANNTKSDGGLLPKTVVLPSSDGDLTNMPTTANNTKSDGGLLPKTVVLPSSDGQLTNLPSLEAGQEDILAALGKPNPQIKQQTALFVSRMLDILVPAKQPKALIKAIVPVIGKLTGDADADVREAAAQALGSIQRLIGDKNLKSLLGDIANDEAKMKKIGEAAEKAAGIFAEEQAKNAPAAPPAASTSSGTARAGSAKAAAAAVTEPVAQQEADPWDFLDAFDVISKMPENFDTLVESKKWQERKEALEGLLTLINANPKLEPKASYGSLVERLQKILEKDANFNVAACAANCLTAIANGLRTKFQPFAISVAPVIFEKFKEKKPTLRDPLVACIDAVEATTNLEALGEIVLVALGKPNPSIKAQTDLFLQRCFMKLNSQTMPKKTLKTLVPLLIKHSGDSDSEVRDASYAAMGAMMRAIGEKPSLQLLADIVTDNLKMGKIKEYHQKALAETGPAKIAAMVQSIHKSDAEAPKKPVAKAPPKAVAKAESEAEEENEEGQEPIANPGTSPASRQAAAPAAVKPRDSIVFLGTTMKPKLEIMQELGRGGFGYVYLGYYERRRVCVKKSIQADRNAFLKHEFDFMRKCNHDNILKAIALVEETNQTMALIMPLYDYDGRKWTDSDHYDPDIAECLSIQLIRAIEYLHNNNILHCDVKPENTLIDSSKSVLVLGDFGLSLFLKTGEYVVEEKRGTFFYIPPEELLSDPVFAFPCDIWSMSMTIFFFLVREEFFDDESALKRLDQKGIHIRVDSQILPYHFRRLLKSGLEVSPDRRSNCQEMLSLINEGTKPELRKLRITKIIALNSEGRRRRDCLMTMFLNCFPKKQIDNWTEELRKIVRRMLRYVAIQVTEDHFEIHEDTADKEYLHVLMQDGSKPIRIVHNMGSINIDHGIAIDVTNKLINGISQFLSKVNDTNLLDMERMVRDVYNEKCKKKLIKNDIKIFSTNPVSLQISINILCSWCSKWKLRLAEHKTNVLHLGPNNPNTKYSANSIPIISTQTTKDLGIWFDNELYFKAHVSKISNICMLKCRQILHCFRSEHSQLYFSLFNCYIRPISDYCCELFCSKSPALTKKLEQPLRFFSRRVFQRCNIAFLSYNDCLFQANIVSIQHRQLTLALKTYFNIIVKKYHFPTLSSFLVPSKSNRYPLLHKTSYGLNNNRFFHVNLHHWNNLCKLLTKAMSHSEITNVIKTLSPDFFVID